MRHIPHDVQTDIQKILTKHCGSLVELQSFSFAGGGCINPGGRLTTSAGNFFLKWNLVQKFPGMFHAEAKGLNLLRASNVITIPEVIGTDTENLFQFILLEFIDTSRQSPDYWIQLGLQLAAMHRVTAGTAGLDHSNYIGSLPQINEQQKSWTEFFINCRLEPQLKLLPDPDLSLLKNFESLYKRLPDVLAEEPHSLLHGDLWSGNLICSASGKPCLIDPAVYYGNREVEISFTHLFGGFENTFYDAYQEAYPLQKGFSERVPIYNLYPLLVHANLFGGGYLVQVKSILKKLI